MTSPIFCARFSDGAEVRMTTWHGGDREMLDLKRGVRLARHAYATRVHNRERCTGFDGPPVVIPGIVEAHFEDEDGVTLQKYTTKELADGRKHAA